VVKDELEASKWYRKAAEQGDANAQSSLGFMYATGNGVVKDELEAYKWSLLAGLQGEEDAKRNTLIIERRLTADQRAEGQRLVREFKPVTRFTHPSAASSVAIASLADGVVPRARAVRSIRGDLLDTYEALLRSSLADTGDALRDGFPEKAAGSAATARGYWWILRETFIGQRGAPAATQLDRAFERLVGAARTGQPAATAAATTTIGDDLLAFRAAPLSASEQARRAGQLIRYLGLVPVEYGRGVANGNVVVPIEIQEAIAFRDGAAIAFGELQSYLAARDLPATRSVQLALAGLDTRLGDAERGTAVADPDEVKTLAKTATSALDDVYPSDWKAGTAEADFSVIATLL
jgi:high-affinity iron transporter